jgi:hypothetical protein
MPTQNEVNQMTTGTMEVEGQVIEVDFSDVKKELKADVKKLVEQYNEELKDYRAKRAEERGGKGIVEALQPDRKAQIIEKFQHVRTNKATFIKEQWTIAIPSMSQYELAAHLRDYVFVTDVVKGSVGEDVNIPYVKDVEFATVTKHTGTFTATTGLVGVYTTTLKEAGAYYDAYYGDIEKIDANLLDELNRAFAHAAVRAEDRELMKLLDAGTTSQFGGASGYCDVGDTQFALVDTHFKSAWIADAIGEMLKKGKELHPGDCVLYMTAIAYESLLSELVASQVIAYARSDIITKGMAEDFMGVRILVGGYETRNAGTLKDTTYQVCYLMRAKRCLGLAPKRDILIETDRIVDKRQLRIAGSHTFGVKALDMTEAVRIFTGQPGLAT